jgi:hypothetical protein
MRLSSIESRAVKSVRQKAVLRALSSKDSRAVENYRRTAVRALTTPPLPLPSHAVATCRTKARFPAPAQL